MRLFSLITAIMALAVISSCKKDKENPVDNPEPEAPKLTITINGNENLTALNSDIGDTIVITAEATASAGIESYTATYTLDEFETSIDTYSSDSLETSYSMPAFTYVIGVDVVDKDFSFDFVLTDTLGATATFHFLLTVNPSPISVHLADTLAPYNDLTVGNFFNVIDNEFYFPLNIKTNTTKQGKVDFIFAHDTQAKWIIMSPDDTDADSIFNHNEDSFNWPFTVINNTRLINQDTAAVDFDEIVTAAQLSDIFEGPRSTILSQLFVGQLISFKLGDSRGGKVGLLKITSLRGNSRTPYRIVFDLKIQN
ncbi:MAG: hypothetical protein RIC35_16390 [Marinoscillum sp.]